jgi:SAM-dependent methyltransferase
MAARDIFRFINDVDKATLQGIVERLEFRGRNPTFRGWLEAYLGELIMPGINKVLVLGCGTGVEVRCLANLNGFAGHIVGVDHSPQLIEVAKANASAERIGHRTEFFVGDVHHLDFADATFDTVIAHTLISHVPEPLNVLKEAARMVKRGGRIAIFDGDYASWTFGYSDPLFAKAMEEAIISSMVNNPRVMRSIPGLLARSGWKLLSVTPHLLAEIGKGSFFLSAMETYGILPLKFGLLPETQVNAWLDEQRSNHEEGVFFASGNYYTYMADRIE